MAEAILALDELKNRKIASYFQILQRNIKLKATHQMMELFFGRYLILKMYSTDDRTKDGNINKF